MYHFALALMLSGRLILVPPSDAQFNTDYYYPDYKTPPIGFFFDFVDCGMCIYSIRC